jgi:hypothetical protein
MPTSPRKGRPQGGMKSEAGQAAYWRMQWESAIGALADLIAEHTETVEELERLRAESRLSRLLFSAREQVEMWADVVESQAGKPATAVRELVAELDAYRAERGWSPHGYGGEEG